MCCKQKTSYEVRISDWSSDVCSSDLAAARVQPAMRLAQVRRVDRVQRLASDALQLAGVHQLRHAGEDAALLGHVRRAEARAGEHELDRKSTRLNSSH